MTQDEHSEDYLDLFRPKAETPPPSEVGEGAEVEPEPVPLAVEEEFITRPSQPVEEPVAFNPSGPKNPGGSGCSCRLWGILLAVLGVLVVLSAFIIWVGWRVLIDKDDEKPKPTPTEAIVSVTPTAAATDSPLVVPLVSSDDVLVPVALPTRLQIGERQFTVQASNAAPESWPAPPADENRAAWTYGTLVNYIVGLAPTAGNAGLLAGLSEGDPIILTLSTGSLLRFNVTEVRVGLEGEVDLSQSRPRLTLALLAPSEAERTVVIANFMSSEINPEDPLAGAVVGIVGPSVEQDGVRVAVLDTHKVSAQEAGLPLGTVYMLVDFSVENSGTTVLQTNLFQLELQTSDGVRYPLSFPALQFANYGLPSDPLAPGETVVGSAGYLVPANLSEPLRWIFNPMPGSQNWVLIDIPLGEPEPTPEPPPPVGFARVTISEDDIFIDQRNGLLIIGGLVENVSQGSVTVTESDIRLSSVVGEGSLVATAPLLPWQIEPGQSALFELQFTLPDASSAMIEVLGYTFSIEGLGGG